MSLGRWLALLILCAACLGCLRSDAAPLQVTITAYCDGTLTAAGTRPRAGIIALSRDVERDLGVRFGDTVWVKNLGRYQFLDRMPWYWHRRVDLYIPGRAQALRFGVRQGVIARQP